MASKVNVDKIARGSGTPEFTIPTADGAANTFLKTDGSGVLSFGAVTTTALTGSTNTWIPTITGANALTGTANFTYDGNILDVKNSGTASSIKLYCESSNAHYQAIKAAPHAGSSDWTLTLPPTVPSVSGQALTATTAGVASWAAVGIPHASQWRLTTGFSGDKAPIDANLEEVDAPLGFGVLGSSMVESAGIFTFPSTGYWLITFHASWSVPADNAWLMAFIYTTTDNSTYTKAGEGNAGWALGISPGYPSTDASYIFAVTNTTTHKCRFDIDVYAAATSTEGNTDRNKTYMTFIRLGDTP